jgi:GntR family transcriptional regulator, transcriptional repressor for pyruvate dehydrogenase complex
MTSFRPTETLETRPASAPRSVLLADVVHDRIRRAIVEGQYLDGARLPGENDLARQFEVSRPVIREALKRLRTEGLIISRQGSGSFVAAQGERKTLAFQPVETVADLQRCYEFRLTIEPAAAAMAATRRSEGQLAEISKFLAMLRDATERHSHREDADFGFHLAITAASNNQYFETSMRALKDHIAVGMKFHGLSLQSVRGGLDHVLDEHAAIFEAIRSGAAETAHGMMLRHVTGSRDRLFEGRLLDLSSR